MSAMTWILTRSPPARFFTKRRIHPEVLQSFKFTQVFLQFGVNSWRLVLRVFQVSPKFFQSIQLTSFIVPLCFLLEILEYFFPEFLFQAIAVKSEQAFQAVPGTEQRGSKKSTLSLWLREIEVGKLGGRNYIQELKGSDNFLCGHFSGIFVRQV